MRAISAALARRGGVRKNVAAAARCSWDMSLYPGATPRHKKGAQERLPFLCAHNVRVAGARCALPAANTPLTTGLVTYFVVTRALWDAFSRKPGLAGLTRDQAHSDDALLEMS